MKIKKKLEVLGLHALIVITVASYSFPITTYATGVPVVQPGEPPAETINNDNDVTTPTQKSNANPSEESAEEELEGEYEGDDVGELDEEEIENEDETEESTESVGANKNSDYLKDEVDTKIEEDLFENFGDSYDYEDALEESFLASQFVVPFTNNLYSVIKGKESSQNLTNLYNETDGSPYDFSYRRLLKKTGENTYTNANIRDLFEIDGNGVGAELYVKCYEVMVEILEDGTEVKHKEPIYEKVYTTNKFSYWYLTLFTNDVSISSAFKQNLNNKTPIVMDQYGNICLWESNGNYTGIMLLPNIANPELSGNDCYLPSLAMVSKYDSTTMYKMDRYIAEGTEVGHNTMVSQVGKNLSSNGILMYTCNDPLTNGNKDDILTNYMTDTFCNVSEEAYGNYYQTFYGISYTDNIWANNTVKTLSTVPFICMEQGRYVFNSKCSTASLLSKDKFNLHMGPFSERTISVKGDFFKGISDHTLTYLTHNVDNNTFGNVLNDAFNWNPDDITGTQVNAFRTLTSDWYSSVDTDKLELIATMPWSLVKNHKEETVKGQTKDPQQQAADMQNTIIKAAYQFVTQPGTSLTAINTAKISKDYESSMKVKDNYLFNIHNIFNLKVFTDMLSKYFLLIIGVIALQLIVKAFMLLKTDGDGIVELILQNFKYVIFTLVPIFIFYLFIMVNDQSTRLVFTDVFSYWSLSGMEAKNNLNGFNRNIADRNVIYFREKGTSGDYNSGQFYVYNNSTNDDDNFKLSDLLQRIDESKLKKVSLNDALTILIRGTETSGNAETILANTSYYSENMFYYFYDNYRYHYYNYYNSDMSILSSSWNNPSGLISTTGRFIDMVSDPYFIYGQSYVDLINSGADISKLSLSEAETLKVQDICGLTYLFSNSNSLDRQTQYGNIEFTPWYEILKDSKYDMYKEEIDPSFYSDGIINATEYVDDDYSLTVFESALVEANKKVAKKLQSLKGYRDYSDESLMVLASLLTTFEVNNTLTKKMHLREPLQPQNYLSETYTLDSINRCIFLDNPGKAEAYNNDLMYAIESDGGSLMQHVVYVVNYIGQFSGIVTLIGALILLLLSLIVCCVSYFLSKDLSNKAWLGVITLFCSLIVVHIVILLAIRVCCISSDSGDATAILAGAANGLKVILLAITYLANIFATVAVLYFAFKHYKDLGGQIIERQLSNNFDSLKGKIRGRLQNKGLLKSRSANSLLTAASVILTAEQLKSDGSETSGESTRGASETQMNALDKIQRNNDKQAEYEAEKSVDGRTVQTESHKDNESNKSSNENNNVNSTNTSKTAETSIQGTASSNMNTSSDTINSTSNNTNTSSNSSTVSAKEVEVRGASTKDSSSSSSKDRNTSNSQTNNKNNSKESSTEIDNLNNLKNESDITNISNKNNNTTNVGNSSNNLNTFRNEASLNVSSSKNNTTKNEVNKHDTVVEGDTLINNIESINTDNVNSIDGSLDSANIGKVIQTVEVDFDTHVFRNATTSKEVDN